MPRYLAALSLLPYQSLCAWVYRTHPAKPPPTSLRGVYRSSVLSQIKRGEYAQEFCCRQGAMTSSGVHHARKSNAADGEKDQHIHHVLFETVH